MIQAFKPFTNVFLYDPEVLFVNLQSLISIIQSSQCLLEVFKELWREMTHIAGIIKDPVGKIVEHIGNNTNFFKWYERKLLFSFVFTFEFYIINYYKSFAYDETKQI